VMETEGHKNKVLVIDDEQGILEFVKKSLTLAGYDVTTTTTGEEGLKLAVSEQPDIILLDILMAPMSGFDVLDNLRTFSQVPVIVFTARSFIASQAIKFGANDSISKPFRPADLVSKITAIIGT
jgi:DNA-binding response OmpR family regulator